MMENHELLSFPVLVTILLFVPIVWSTILKKLIRRKEQSTPNPPPGPWKLPFIGNIHQLIHPLAHRRLRDLAKKYGPVMQLQIGEVSTVIISSVEAAKEVLKTHEINFLERPNLLVSSIMFYNRQDIGFAQYGDYWRGLRKICILELLSQKRIKSFKSIREEEVSDFITSIHAKEGYQINLSRMIFSLTTGVIARTSVSKKYKDKDAFFPIIEQVLEAIGGLNVVDIFPSSIFFRLISQQRSKLLKMHQEADKILESIITEHKANSTLSSKNEVDDLLDVLLNLQQREDLEFSLTTSGIKAIILEMFSAGSDTSSTVLEWAMSELMKNPKVMEKAQKEVRQVFSNMEKVDETSLQELHFLKLVIKETLRLHPPLPLIPRECGKRCEIKGYEIDAKSKVLINAWTIGRDPNYWIEADKFYPERFMDCSSDYKGTNFEFIPFGAGKRMCPGMGFGLANVEFPLAQMLYHFDWKLPDGMKPENLDMTEAFGGSVKRKRELHLIPISYRSLA